MYALARRFTTPWWATLASLTLSVTLPFIYFTRATFSEATSLALGIAGLWVATRAFDDDGRFAFGAGLLLGGTALVRVDGWTSGLALALLVAWTHLEADAANRHVAERLWRGFLVVGLLGIVDIVGFSLPYVFILGAHFQALVASTLVLRLAAPLAGGVGRTWSSKGLPRTIGQAAAAFSVGGLLLSAWLVRPAIGEARSGTPYALEAIQRREGLLVDPTRSYDELSMAWIGWYVGAPVLALGCFGIAVGCVPITRQERSLVAADRLCLVSDPYRDLHLPSIHQSRSHLGDASIPADRASRFRDCGCGHCRLADPAIQERSGAGRPADCGAGAGVPACVDGGAALARGRGRWNGRVDAVGVHSNQRRSRAYRRR